MLLFIKIQFFIILGPNLGPDFEIFSQFQEMLLWITSSASCYLAKKQKTLLWGYADPMRLFIKHSIFRNYTPKFGPRFWDIFSISGNALMNHFFSIVIPCEKAKYGSVRFCGSNAPFHQSSIFHNFGPKFRPRFWDIFSISGNALMNHFFSIVISCERAKTDCVRFLRIRCTCSSNIQFFIIIGLNLGPDFEMFSQFQEMRLWITSLAS